MSFPYLKSRSGSYCPHDEVQALESPGGLPAPALLSNLSCYKPAAPCLLQPDHTAGPPLTQLPICYPVFCFFVFSFHLKCDPSFTAFQILYFQNQHSPGTSIEVFLIILPGPHRSPHSTPNTQRIKLFHLTARQHHLSCFILRVFFDGRGKMSNCLRTHTAWHCISPQQPQFRLALSDTVQ